VPACVGVHARVCGCVRLVKINKDEADRSTSSALWLVCLQCVLLGEEKRKTKRTQTTETKRKKTKKMEMIKKKK